MSDALRTVDTTTAVMAVLSARFGLPRTRLAVTELTSFQHDAVVRLRDILVRRRGAILADSVGLGKTHVAHAVAAEIVAGGGGVLVCGPAQLRRHWARHMTRVHQWSWLSHTALSRGRSPRCMPTLTVVDEAHAFRNPHTRRYQTLLGFAPGTKLLLLTATPVNNSIFDFYHLVRLFAARDDFDDVGVADLLTAADAAIHGDTASIRRVAEAVVVRRTRGALRLPCAGTDGAAQFPRLDGIRPLDYNLSGPAAGELTQMLHVVQRVNFTAHTAAGGSAVSPHLLGLGLLKRLESSTEAFERSVTRHLRILEHFRAAAEQGLLFCPARDAALLQDVDRAVQLSLSPLVLRPWPARLDLAATTSAAAADIAHLQQLRASIDAVGSDAKLQRLQALLVDVGSDKVLIFTEYRHTAVYLWRCLKSLGGVAVIHGLDARLGDARAARSTVVDRFAPLANSVRVPRLRERVDVLIATDVLAEGMNLQDARVVVSYDLPWNPVRLAQRVGRVDRLGSPHEWVAAYAFRPGRSLEGLLRVMQRMRHKVRQIRAVGGDVPRMHARRQPLSRDDDDAVVANETLRERYRQWLAVHEHTECRYGVAAAATWFETAGATLSCWSAGSSVRYFLSTGARTTELSLAEADMLLLRALRAPRAAADTALRPVQGLWDIRRRLQRGPRPVARPYDTARVLARAVRQWLHEQPHGPSPEQLDAAETILTGAPHLDAAGEAELRRLIRSGDRETAIRRATRLISSASADWPLRARTPAQNRLLAVIEFAPVTSSPASGGRGTG